MSDSISVPLANRDVLLARLANAEAAYDLLVTGQQVSVASYGQGDGSKMVTYTRSSATTLAAYIATLRRQLGARTRAPIIPSFR